MRIVRSPNWTRSVILLVALAIFPVLAYWIWGGGWIAQRGFYDFAGAAPVHFAAGLCMLTGSVLAGPRKGRTWGAPPKHTGLAAALGFGLLAFGLLAYHPAGMAAILQSDGIAGRLLVNGTASAVVGAFSAAGLISLRRQRWEFGSSIKGAIAGLAAVSGGWIWMNVIGAAAAGAAAGIGFVAADAVLEMLHVDDWFGGFAVHGVGGAIGALATGIFLDGGLTGGPAGLLMGGGVAALSDQCIGLVAVGLCAGIVSTLVLLVIKANGYLRASQRERVMLFGDESSASDISVS